VWLHVPGMESKCVPALVGCRKAFVQDANCSAYDIKVWLTLSGTHTQRPLSWRGWRNRRWMMLLSGTISQPLTADRFTAWWTSQLRACRVSHTLALAGSLATPTIAASETATAPCPISSASWEKCDPPWCSSKTSLPGFEEDGFDLSERNYADWVMKSKARSLSLLRRLARRIDASECSSWPTIRSHEVGDYQNQKDGTTQPTLTGATSQWASPNGMGGGSVSRGGERIDEPLLAGQAQQWATPNSHERTQTPREVDHGIQLANQVDQWQTPAGQMHTSRCQVGAEEREDLLPDQAANFSPLVPVTSTDGIELSPTALSTSERRRLNPAFVCWLMGSPWWWTRADPISFAAQEMVAFRCKQHYRLSFLLKGLGYGQEDDAD